MAMYSMQHGGTLLFMGRHVGLNTFLSWLFQLRRNGGSNRTHCPTEQKKTVDWPGDQRSMRHSLFGGLRLTVCLWKRTNNDCSTSSPSATSPPPRKTGYQILCMLHEQDVHFLQGRNAIYWNESDTNNTAQEAC